MVTHRSSIASDDSFGDAIVGTLSANFSSSLVCNWQLNNLDSALAKSPRDTFCRYMECHTIADRGCHHWLNRHFASSIELLALEQEMRLAY